MAQAWGRAEPTPHRGRQLTCDWIESLCDTTAPWRSGEERQVIRSYLALLNIRPGSLALAGPERASVGVSAIWEMLSASVRDGNQVKNL